MFMSLTHRLRAAGISRGEPTFRDQQYNFLWKAGLCLKVKDKLGQDAAETKILLLS